MENKMETSNCKVCKKEFTLPDRSNEAMQRVMNVVNKLHIQDAKDSPSTWDWFMSEQLCSETCAQTLR